jgi:hypothetical protein
MSGLRSRILARIMPEKRTAATVFTAGRLREDTLGRGEIAQENVMRHQMGVRLRAVRDRGVQDLAAACRQYGIDPGCTRVAVRGRGVQNRQCEFVRCEMGSGRSGCTRSAVRDRVVQERQYEIGQQEIGSASSCSVRSGCTRSAARVRAMQVRARRGRAVRDRGVRDRAVRDRGVQRAAVGGRSVLDRQCEFVQDVVG